MTAEDAWRERRHPGGPVYLTFDLDALDPAFAPGVSHHEPGGLSVRDVLGALSRSSALRIVGADVVEYPDSDKVAASAGAGAARKRFVFKRGSQVDYYEGEPEK